MRLHASGVCHSDLNAIDGTAETRCPAVLGHEGAGVVEAVGAGVALARRARTWCSPGCRPAGAAPSACATCRTCARRRGRDGHGRPARRHAAALARRRAGLPLLVPVDVRRARRRARGLLRPDPGRRAVRGRGAGRLRGHHRHRRGLADAPACGRASASRCSAAAASGCARCSARPRWARRRSWRSTWPTTKLEAALALGATRRGALGRRRRRRPRSAVRAVDAAAASTTRSRRPGGREAALAAFLSTRARGAAVLHRDPRAPTPCCRCRRCSIPRMERRVLGSLYGSARPERDFPAMLDLYRRGRLPLDRLVSHRLPLDAVERRVRRCCAAARRCASVLDLTEAA